MTDERNYIQKQIDRYRSDTGRDPSADEVAIEFSKISDVGARLNVLDDIDASSGARTLEEAARYSPYERALKSTHRFLRSIGR